MKKLLALLVSLGLCMWLMLIAAVVGIIRGDQPGQQIAAFSRSILSGRGAECREQNDDLGAWQSHGTDQFSTGTKTHGRTNCRS